MIEPALRKLRLDSRLIGRRGWIDKQDLDRELEALPDVSEKMAAKEESSGSPGVDAPAGAERPGDSR